MNQNFKINEVIVSSSNSTKKHLIDNIKETCWVSSHKKDQYVILKFKLCVNSLKMTFQPGFQPKRVALTSSNLKTHFEMSPNESSKVIDIGRYLEDLRIDFFESYDPYNRICVYGIELL